ncbi:MAG: hypothetical protein HWE24_20255 [Oceanospirillaceae bacterium]|nr:hypothetical protein [Oceanospirillaceae bacterium]
MSSLSQKLKELLESHTITAYIIVVEGGGTGNEASAARLGSYLAQELSMEVKFLTFLPTANMFKNEVDIFQKCNKNSIAKLTKLKIPETQIVTTEIGLLTEQRFFVFCAADVSLNQCNSMGLDIKEAIKAVATRKKTFQEDLFLGSVNLNPFAWHSDWRGLFDHSGKEIKFPEPLPILADYPELTPTENPLNNQKGGFKPNNKHELVELLNPQKLNCELMITYGLHALYENEPADYRFVARAFTGLVKGLHKYVSNQKKSVVLLALHPKNTSDFTILHQHCGDEVIWYNGTEESVRDIANCTKIHLLSSKATNLNNVVNEITKIKVPQVIVIQKQENDNIPPDSFRDLLHAATLPTLSEGANTVGQLIQIKKPFWTIAEAEKQLPPISNELKSLQYWQLLLTAVFKLPALQITEDVEKKFNEVESNVGEKARAISKEFRKEMMEKGIETDNIETIATHTNNSINNNAISEYFRCLGNLNSIFHKECQNQVLLALTLWHANKHDIAVKKTE